MKIRFPFLSFFVCLLAPAILAAEPPALYEENLVDSMPIRERQWKQIEAYIAALPPIDTPADYEKVQFDKTQIDFTSEESYRRTIEPLRRQFCNRIGYPPPSLFEKVEIRLEKVGEDAVAVYHRAYIPIAPDLECYGLYIIPKEAKLPAPLVIAQHGGGGYPELATFHGGSNYHDLVRGAVARGWIVFAPHHVFYSHGDRDHATPIPSDVREQLDERLRRRGTSLAALEVAKISKALDALLTRPEIDADRVAMAGLSYGGFYTLYTAALEPRIGAAVCSCAMGGWQDRVEPYERPIDRKTGGVLVDLMTAELAALICPRRLQVQSGTDDTLFPIEAARDSSREAAEYFRSLDRSDAFSFEAFPGGHEFNGSLAWPFLEKYFSREEAE